MKSNGLSPCKCGGKPWFNLQTIVCLKCPTRIPPRFGNFETCATEWNNLVNKGANP